MKLYYTNNSTLLLLQIAKRIVCIVNYYCNNLETILQGRCFWSIFEVKLYYKNDSTLLSLQMSKHIACIVNYYRINVGNNSPGSVFLEYVLVKGPLYKQ